MIWEVLIVPDAGCGVNHFGEYIEGENFTSFRDARHHLAWLRKDPIYSNDDIYIREFPTQKEVYRSKAPDTEIK